MPYNGSGTFSPLTPPTYPAVAGTTIEAAKFNAVINDIHQGLSAAFPRNGEGAATGNWNLGTNRITNLANAVGAQDAATKAQVDAGDAAATAAAVVAAQLPIGAIIMWYGTVANIPSGWQRCDGTNGTPDLRQRFPRGAAAAVTGVPSATGGSDNAIVVEHTHSVTGTAASDGDHSHTVSGAPSDGSGSGGWPRAGIPGNDRAQPTTSFTGAHTHSVTGTAVATGSSGTGANVPAYADVHFIMRVS
jgi:hypothetical protein